MEGGGDRHRRPPRTLRQNVPKCRDILIFISPPCRFQSKTENKKSMAIALKAICHAPNSLIPYPLAGQPRPCAAGSPPGFLWPIGYGSCSGGWCYVFRQVWCYCPQAQPSPGIYLSTPNYYSIVSVQSVPHTVHLTCKDSPRFSGGGIPRRDIMALLCLGMLPSLPRLHFGQRTGLLVPYAVTLSCTTIKSHTSKQYAY